MLVAPSKEPPGVESAPPSEWVRVWLSSGPSVREGRFLCSATATGDHGRDLAARSRLQQKRSRPPPSCRLSATPL
jgi:hypothetical protein